MATEKQKRAVENLVGNGGNVTDAMRKAGYSENTANTPQKLTQSEGYKKLLDGYGLTEDLIVESLVEDIRKKPQNRKSELELGAKIRGMLNDKLDLTSNGKDLVMPVLVKFMSEHEQSKDNRDSTGV